jgi:TPR repeat protein
MELPRPPHKLLLHVALAALLCFSLFSCKMPNDPMNTLPRNQSLPKFNPHMPTFTCEVEAVKVPAIDAQADAWFLEARALESPETIEEDRDYKKIVELTRKAADRKHWKAMLNLASLYLEKRDPARGVDDALNLVDEAMKLGIPGAYDRMGTYFMNGTGVDSDATRAFAFWQKAAQMGSPQAMTFLANKMDAAYDSPNDGWWANKPVATKMLECAFGQGHGLAAKNLSSLIAGSRPATGRGNRTVEASARAVKVLHEGVKLGCEECANNLRAEFDGVFGIADILPTHIDKARSERYRIIQFALGFDPDQRFPSLDQVLPLPPAPLPSWNGDRDTLLNAAMGVKPKPAPPKPTAASLCTEHNEDAVEPRAHDDVTEC